MIFDFIITFLLVFALFSFFIAVVGVIRLPDFYTRVHSASIGDTLSTMLLLLAAILFHLKDCDFSSSSILTSLKIFFIIIFMFLTGPTGIHVLMNAGYELGRKPFLKKNLSNDKDEKDNKKEEDK